MPTALWLLAVAIVARLIPHPVNMVPMCALALYGAARLPRRWALFVPLAAWVISDTVIDLITPHGYSFSYFSRLPIYGTITVIALAGSYLPRRSSLVVRVGAAAGAQTFFFLVSNLAVWVAGEGFRFPMTLGGLLSNYAVALPFFRNGLIADVVATVVLFGAEWLWLANLDRHSRTAEFAE